MPKPDPKYKNMCRNVCKENIDYSKEGKLVEVSYEHFVYKVENKIGV